jgi:nitrogenase subunit NifH
MISEQRVEAAVEFIRDHAEQIGTLIGHVKGLEHQRKVVRGIQFLESEKKTVADREADAESSPEYKAIVEDIENAWSEAETLKTKMRAAELTIEVWRSQNSSRNKGHL